MNCLFSRRPTGPVGSRRCLWNIRSAAVALAAVTLGFTVRAAAAEQPLTLAQVQRLAVVDQPMLESLQAQARAEHESAIAARQLPDPQLTAGVVDLPIDTRDAGSFSRDSDTQVQVGLMQTFPRASKRRLRGEIGDGESRVFDAQAQLADRTIRREAGLAWLERWKAEQAVQLTLGMSNETRNQAEAVEIALKSNTASQADLLAARIADGRARDTAAEAAQSVAHAKSMLSRWIGDAADWPLEPATPILGSPSSLDELMARLDQHPALQVLQARMAVAHGRSDLARANYSPDWRVEVGYGNREAYSDMVMLKVGIDLPFFTRDRQDRELAAAQAQQEAAEFSIEDARRQLESELRLNHHDWLRIGERLRTYDEELLPQARQRIDASTAVWRSGKGALALLLDARRSLLELQMSRLDLQADAIKHAIELTYLDAGSAASDAPESTHE